MSLSLWVPAAAKVNPDSALHAYARARLADDEGALGLAVDNYRAALNLDPARTEIARRSYVQAMESGDRALALRSAALLDQEGALPRDGTLLRIGEALGRKDWAGATRFTDRMVEEGNFAFIAPILRSWISLGAGRYTPPILDGKDRFSALAQRYIDEHVALLCLARKDVGGARPAIAKAMAARSSDTALLRLEFAAQLAALGEKADALSLLPDKNAIVAPARAAVLKGKGLSAIGAPLTPAQGYARLMARLAADVGGDGGSGKLGLRLARIATFTDPQSADAHLIAARLLTAADQGAAAIAQARAVPDNGWYSPMAQVELVDALAADGQDQAALTLAQALTQQPGAETDRFVRLGRLLADQRNFDAAATAFRAAQARFPTDAVPWTLLLFEGSALEQGKRWDEARAVLQRAAKIAPNEPVILNYLGYAQIERRENVDAALALLKRASALKPDDPAITDSLGWAQFVTGDAEAAVPMLERAALGAPADATVNEHLGDALWTVGRRYEARYAWRAASVTAQGDIAARLDAKTKEGWTPEYAAP